MDPAIIAARRKKRMRPLGPPLHDLLTAIVQNHGDETVMRAPAHLADVFASLEFSARTVPTSDSRGECEVCGNVFIRKTVRQDCCSIRCAAKKRGFLKGRKAS